MRTLIFITLLMLIAPAVAFSQENKDKKLPRPFESTFDKFDDETRTSFMVWDSGPLKQVGFRHAGQQLTEDVTEFFLIFSGSRCHGYCFHDPALTFLIDDQKLSLPEKKGLKDTVVWFVDRETMQRLVSAGVVEFKVGYFTGKVGKDDKKHLKLLLDFATVKKEKL